MSIMTDSAPQSPMGKFFYYRKKYGAFCTLLSCGGRKSPTFWSQVGSYATNGYLRQWLKKHPDAQSRIMNLGGGSHRIVNCLNVDIDPHADVYTDITKPLPFHDSSFGAIFCEEVIEHIDLQRGRQLLREVYRVLTPGGFFRCITPDLVYFATTQLASPIDTSVLNNIFYLHGHRHIYSPDELCAEMAAAGFKNIRRSSYQDSDSRLGYLDSHPIRFQHPPEISQYIEAQKVL